jgi:hypothetical protein
MRIKLRLVGVILMGATAPIFLLGWKKKKPLHSLLLF